MAESSSAAQEKSQYHHFIPRFILRNYSHPGEPEIRPRTSKKRGKRKNKPRAAEPMLYGINLAGEEAEITETTVAKTFGMMDMYRDHGAPMRQHQVEEQLSVLESRAGEIISTIRKAFEAGKDDVWITRTQRDTLRKFLFIMKYRNSSFHKRYCHENADDYNEDDREGMLKYMKEKGFTKPVDVWFDNIKGILDLKMDYRLEWVEKLQKRIYPDDARWFISNVQQFYMALVTPTKNEDEFLLTENAYSIYEGATSHRINPANVPEEDFDAIGEEERQAFFDAAVAPHDCPEQAGFFLRDLPITKALNSYSKIVDGRLVLINGGPTGINDRFGFRFFSIPEEYVNKINSIMLDQSYRITLIVFNNKAAAYKALENYFALRGKFVIDTEVSRVLAIVKLKQAAKLLATTLPMQKDTDQRENLFREEKMLRLQMPQILEMPEDKVYALFVQDEKAKKLYSELRIPKLEEAAKFLRKTIEANPQDLPKSPINPIFTMDERIELATRALVKGYNGAVMGDEKLIEKPELEKVLFEVVYPSFGSRQKAKVAEREKPADEGSRCVV
ncbi:hypothetical protein G7Y89_g890 [Cudoniella acicularis]|uniref:DUF4238 domain-containing protein n=1 Tax=Cudoniella acicularis TaxID=354080 RepID=A0A8H4RXB7_9HELO|nr:hypothetical protein G7Y89_g890 [Cudoniella acicularis]